MNLEIKSTNIKPLRGTYANIARRQGSDKPASRYDEATMDMQPTTNFHYRPLWRPEFTLYDENLTAIKMADWYSLRDPRQFYYGTYNFSRAAMSDAAEKNLKMVEKDNLLAMIAPAWRQKILDYLGPMRHFEWGANMNNYQICADGYGAAIASPAAFCAHDHLGMAQIITRIVMAFDGGGGALLDATRETWLTAPYWQEVRHMMEDSFVLEDWFLLFVAQNLAMDGILHPLIFDAFDKAGRNQGALGLSMVTQFMVDCHADNSRWVDAVIKRAAEESAENRGKLSAWAQTWSTRALTAAKPLAQHTLGADANGVLAAILTDQNKRMQTLGLMA
jgi:phenol hydroxylase P1 protein